MSTGSNRRRSVKGEKSRETMLNAAQRLFAERGYQSVSLDEIASRSGATRSLILYHFKSKIGLWRAASTEAAAAFNDAVRENLKRMESSPRTDARYANMAAWLDAFVDNPIYPKMLVQEGSAPGQRLDWLIAHFEYAQNVPGTPLLQERMTQTVLRDAVMAIFLAMGALGPLMEASMAKVSGQAKVGIYPMSAKRREELINLLLRIVATFESGEM